VRGHFWRTRHKPRSTDEPQMSYRCHRSTQITGREKSGRRGLLPREMRETYGVSIENSKKGEVATTMLPTPAQTALRFELGVLRKAQNS
jgi:hypothetical protein